MQLARPSYSDMAALIELGEKPFYLNVLILILECLFLESCFSGGFSQQLCFMEPGLVVKLPLL